MTNKTHSSRTRFSSALKWALVAVVAVFLTPSVITFVRSQIDGRDRLKADERRFERYHRDLKDVLEHSSPGKPVSFPECIRKTSISERDISTTTFFEVEDIVAKAPSTILCETKREYAKGRLVLLLDGTVAFRRDDGEVSPAVPHKR